MAHPGGAIPDDDDLASDISGPKQKWRANNDWLLGKQDRNEGAGAKSGRPTFRMPALTFATKEWFDSWKSADKAHGLGALALTKMTAFGRMEDRSTEPGTQMKTGGITRAILRGWDRGARQWPEFVTT
jgi:hypothetical protein